MGFFSSRKGNATGTGNYLPAWCGTLDLALTESITSSESRKEEGGMKTVASVRIVRVVTPGRVKVKEGEIYTILYKIPAAKTKQGPGLDGTFKLIRAFSNVPANVLSQGGEAITEWAANEADRAVGGANVGVIGKIARCTVTGSDEQGTYNKIQWDFAADTSKAPVQGANNATTDDDDEAF